MQLNHFRGLKLQRKIDRLPDSNTILSKELLPRDNGSYAIAKPKNNKDRNNTWQANHRLIIEYIERVLDGLHRLPTVKEISKELKISHVTIHAHLKHYKNNPSHELERGMMNLMAEKLLLTALRKGGDFYATTKDLKNALACYKMMNAISGPEIIINNVKIDINIFNNLPENKKSQIIDILMEK